MEDASFGGGAGLDRQRGTAREPPEITAALGYAMTIHAFENVDGKPAPAAATASRNCAAEKRPSGSPRASSDASCTRRNIVSRRMKRSAQMLGKDAFPVVKQIRVAIGVRAGPRHRQRQRHAYEHQRGGCFQHVRAKAKRMPLLAAFTQRLTGNRRKNMMPVI